MDIDTRDLRYFLAISEELNISRAARRLFVSQPLLSQRLARLESLLGTPLVRRVRTGVTLTAAGAALVPFAERVTEDWRSTRALLAEHAAREDDSVVLGLSVPSPNAFVMEAGTRLRETHESLRLVVRRPSWSDPSGGLVAGTADAALIRLPMGSYSGLTSRVVARTPVVALLPPDHRLSGESELCFADIEDEPILAPPRLTGPSHEVAVAQALRSRPARLAGAVYSWEELIDGVSAGNGVALVPASAADAAMGRVAARPVTDLPLLETALAWRVSADRDVVRSAIPVIRRVAERMF